MLDVSRASTLLIFSYGLSSPCGNSAFAFQHCNQSSQLASFLTGLIAGIEFPIAKLLDYEARWQALEESRNPFAVMVMAHLKTKTTNGQPQARKQWKWSLVRKLFEQGYSRSDVVELFRLIDWMMTLPQELEQEFRDELRQYQEERQMPYITSVERLAREEGELETLQEVIVNILKLRFNEVPQPLVERLHEINDVTHLKQIYPQAVLTQSLGEFQQSLE